MNMREIIRMIYARISIWMLIAACSLCGLTTPACAATEISTPNTSTSTQNEQNQGAEVSQSATSDQPIQGPKEDQDKPLRFSTYHPIYFVEAVQHNDDDANTIVNISLKYKVIADQGLYFGYSQLMFWDKDKDSAPFKDINYNPELFYRLPVVSDFIRSVDLGIFEHKSNGRDGEASRSWDRQYVQLNTAYKYFEWFHLKKVVKWDIKYFVLREDGLSDNRDIGNYIGNWLSRITIDDYLDFGILKQIEVYCEFYAGGQEKNDLLKGGVEYGYIFNAEFFGMNPRVYIQAFNGYGHSLLNYRQIENAVRIGLIIQ